MFIAKWITRSVPGRKALARAAVVAAAIGTTLFAFTSASRADGSYFDWCSKANTSCQTGVVAGDPWNFDKCVQDTTHLTTVCVVYDGDPPRGVRARGSRSG
ncbi:hypothetical protein [Actinoplanes sp. NPDC026623]|uniref:hypothetical protein n=1 Tax=Actinoplanes sp. NPDC026623 TaxID=3155610 RepID=UPI0033DD3FDC